MPGPGDALLVVHDVWGRTSSLVEAADRIASALGATAHVPDHLGRPVPPGASNADAYEQFMADVGVDELAARVAVDAARLRATHGRVLGLGFSVGASAAWVAGTGGAFDALVCVYGSRIRDHAGAAPSAPCLALFASEEQSFDPHTLARTISTHPTVAAAVVGGGHGFCNPRAATYDPSLAREVERRATAFLGTGEGR